MSMPRQSIVKVDLSSKLQRIERGTLLATADKMANRMGAEVYQNGKAATLTGYTVKGSFIRTGTDTISLVGKIDGNKAYVDLSENCYLHDGSFTLSVKLCKSGYEQTLVIFDGYIAQTATDKLVENENIIDIAELSKATEALSVEVIKRDNVENLLHNSYFKINQRGETSYQGIRSTIDRWKLTNGNTVLSILENGIKLTNTVAASGGYLQQTMKNPAKMLGKTYTLAAKQTNGKITVASGTLPVAFPDAIMQYATMSDAGVTVGAIQVSTNSVWVRIWSNPNEDTRSFEWAKLFEGVYTADTLPQDQQRPEMADMLECMHYLQYRSTGDVAAVDLRPPMRAVPTITKIADGRYEYNAEL